VHFDCVELVEHAQLDNLDNTSSTRRARLAGHARHDELDMLDTTSCTGSTRRTFRVVLRRDVTSQVEFGLIGLCDRYLCLDVVQCEELLLHDGDFLVRETPATPGQYVLSGRHSGCIRHLLLVDPEGKVCLVSSAVFNIRHRHITLV